MEPSTTSFGTDGVRGRFGQAPITVEHVKALGTAFGQALREQCPRGVPAVVVGRDTRFSGPALQAALTQGLNDAGVDVWLAQVVPTPAVAWLTSKLGAQAGAVISASHNPAHDNGVKFFDAKGTKISDALQQRVVQLLRQPCGPAKQPGRVSTVDDAGGLYATFVLQSEPGLRLEGLSVVVDAAHGAVSGIAEGVLRALGAKVHSIASWPDGTNINAGCGATSLEALRRAVLEQNAYMGLAFDGDADRLMLVGRDARVLDGDAILYLLAKDRKAQQAAHGRVLRGVVGTVMTNAGLENSLRKLSVELVRTRVGDRYLTQELQARGWELAAESSGHVLDFSKLSTGDALLAALGVLAGLQRSGRDLERALDGLELFPQHTVNVRLDEGARRWRWEDEESVSRAVRAAQTELASAGRVLVRASGTEPLIRVMVEASSSATARRWAQQLADVLRAGAARHCAA